MRATVLRFREGVVFADAPEGLDEAFRMLSGGGATEDELADRVLATAGGSALPHLYLSLRRLGELGFLRYTVVDGGEHVLTVVPVTCSHRLQAAAGDGRWRLSRFASLRRVDDSLVLESPLATARAVLDAPKGALLVARLVSPCASKELHEAVPGLGEGAAEDALALLFGAGLVGGVDANGALPGECGPVLAQWEPHDLAF